MNKVIMTGRLTADPQVSTNNTTTVTRFSIAVDRRFKREGEPDADFFNCVTFNKKAEFVEKYFHKGNRIAIVGRIENNNYTNNDGQKVYSTSILVDEVEFGESKSNSNSTESGAKSSDGFMSIPTGIEDELPFA